MQRRMIWVGSVLATGMLALGACIGTMDGEGETDPVGENVQLVAKRRDWLKGYDNHCDSCFEAFELCEKGAADESEEDACQIALDACVRGGLVDKNDAGVVDEDAEVDVDEDAGIEDEDAEVEEDVDEEEVDEGEEEVDAGVDEDEEELDEEEADEEDAGVDEEDEEEEEVDEDVDAGVDEEEEEVDEDVDAGEAELDADAAKQQLIEDVEVCLDTARECIDANAEEAQQCVLETVTCIQAALEKAFDVICAEQLEAVQAKQGKGARKAEAQLRGLCEQSLAL